MKKIYTWIISVLVIIVTGVGAVYLVGYFKSNQENYATFTVDGEVYKSDVLIENGSIKRLPETPKKEGYTFEYWEVNGQKYNVSDKFSDDVILKAVFKEVEKDEIVVVTFESDNGEEDSIVEVLKKNKISYSNIPEKEGYKFLGWYLNDDKIDFDKYIFTSNITLIAKWENIKYTVSFNTDGGSAVKEQNVEYGKKVTIPSNPTKTGYKFLGWYLNNQKYDFNKIVTTNITLKAKWQKVEIKVAYGDLNEDGVVDLLDALKTYKYLSNTITLSEQAKKNADVNADGKINNTDMRLIMRFVSGYYENTLPGSPIKDYIMHGDLNEDGMFDGRDNTLMLNYLQNIKVLSAQGKKNADINSDSKVNKVDYWLMKRCIREEYENYYDETNLYLGSAITNYVIYGDVDENGDFDSKDLEMLESYFEDNISLSSQAKKNADINGDGNLNEVELWLMRLCFRGDFKEYDKTNLYLDQPVKDYKIYGDVDENGIIDSEDLNLLTNYLKLANNNDIAASRGLSEQGRKNADVDDNGILNEEDARLLPGWYRDYWSLR